MAEMIAIAGSSGSGKSTAAKNLNPKTTFYINSDRKSLPFQGWRADYNVENKNYYHESSTLLIKKKIEDISANMPHIKTLVWDTVNISMLDNEFARMKEAGFDKWADLVFEIWAILQKAGSLRDDLVMYHMYHTQSVFDEDGVRERRILTNGKKLNKIVPESKYTVVLMTYIDKKGEGDNSYHFETQANNSTAKTPEGMFKKFLIPNDLAIVDKQFRKYNGMEPIEYRKQETKE